MYHIPNQPNLVFILSTMYLPDLFYIVKKMLHMLGLIYHCLGLEIHLIIITKGRRKLWTVTGGEEHRIAAQKQQQQQKKL